MKLPLQAVAAANEVPCDENCHERASDTYSPGSPENVSAFCGAAGDGDGEEARSLPHPSDTPAASNHTALRRSAFVIASPLLARPRRGLTSYSCLRNSQNQGGVPTGIRRPSEAMADNRQLR